MPEESYGFAKARVRLEEIVSQVRKKDTSLEKSLDLLEEGVRLANQCTELIDHADWDAAAAPAGDGDEAGTAGDSAPAEGMEQDTAGAIEPATTAADADAADAGADAAEDDE